MRVSPIFLLIKLRKAHAFPSWLSNSSLTQHVLFWSLQWAMWWIFGETSNDYTLWICPYITQNISKLWYPRLWFRWWTRKKMTKISGFSGLKLSQMPLQVAQARLSHACILYGRWVDHWNRFTGELLKNGLLIFYWHWLIGDRLVKESLMVEFTEIRFAVIFYFAIG